MWTSEGALKGDIEEDTLRRQLRGTLMEDTEPVKNCKNICKMFTCKCKNVHLSSKKLK